MSWCPSRPIRRTRSGFRSAHRPLMLKLAVMPFAFSVSSICVVKPASAAASKLSAIVLRLVSRRRMTCAVVTGVGEGGGPVVGTKMTCPTTISSGSARALAPTIACTVVPKRRAIAESVSPGFTTYRTPGGTVADGVGLGPGDGDTVGEGDGVGEGVGEGHGGGGG